MKQIRILLLALIALAALPLLAAPQVAVYRNWDNQPVTNLEVIDYGDTEVSTPISRLFRIENHGNATLNVSVSLTQPESFAASIIEQPSPTVAPGGSTSFRVRLFYHTDGRYFGYVNVSTNDPMTPLFRFTVMAYLHGPLSAMYQAWTGFSQANGSSYDFGTIPAGTVVQRSFKIVNSGTRNLVISNVNSIVSGTAFVQYQSPPTIISQAGEGLVGVRFGPMAANTIWDGQIAVYTNDTPRSPYVIYLRGRTN
jgi:hypothetical protein